ncbi:hypothetical protein M569_02209, partial [Genlisea aurea]
MARNLSFCFSRTNSPEQSADRRSPGTFFDCYNALYETSSFSTASDEDPAGSADFASAVASRRFFFSSPGRSNSIVDSSHSSSSSSSSSSASDGANNAVSRHGVEAVPTYSPDPFADFRRSMQEMVEAREIHDVGENWDYLHELLICYLSLNPESTHEFIVGAFADLIVSLMAANTRRK